VPILLEEKVVGIIDAQHPERDFIRPGHLRMLTTIAALCSQKIKGLAMEQAYRQVERKLQEANKHMAETKLLALRMQMSPHFIFNSLTSVNHFILQEEPEQASQLLTKFSRLLRQVLENAKSEWVLLRKELYALQLYLELEQMRCNHYFEVVLAVGEEVNPDAVLLPPLVIHPFVENAIWHGLLHQKKGKPVLHINCWIEENQLLVCVRDNGIGRVASGQLYRNALTTHKLWGIQCIEQRLRIVNEVFEVNARVQIEDLCDAAGNTTGTSVTFSTNLQQPWQPFE
jgi:LytS/YehU family sensor histidine kinase